MMFRDRAEAGHELAQRLAHYAGRGDVIVLALPRGGVPVGFELAAELRVTMDLFLVRKLGVPWQPELAMGAVASGGVRVINQEVVRACGITPDQIERASTEQNTVLEQNEHRLRNDRPAPSLDSKVVILVDDGLATGSTMRAAIAAVRTQHPQRVVVAVPVGAEATCADMRAEVDEMVCASTPEPFWAVGQWYADFSPVSDEEVRDLLARAEREHHAA